jgi:indolepyruvate ferredoxin oxidoreductase
MILLGYAWQRGGIPLSHIAIVKAIELNERSVKTNLAAFEAGRSAALEATFPEEAVEGLNAVIERRAADLVRYWNARYARRYVELMTEVRAASENVEGGSAFAWAVARAAYQLMAYKDEYEVARLYTDGRFRAALANEFEGVGALRIHLSPPILARTDPRTGHPRKLAFGAWIFPALSLLAALKPLRESLLDPFSRMAERRLERDLREAYFASVHELCANLSPESLERATCLARKPLAVRGFGHVKGPAARALLAELRKRG